jgi:tetratricopeptide (TPR) repeat protein
VRITAQLIRAADGTHVWADSYDRQLTDVFAVQEDIATAIAGALRMPLGLKSGERLVSNRGIDAGSYEKYLRAKALIRDRIGDNGPQSIRQAVDLLQDVTAHNPNYAPAWARLAYAYDYMPNAATNPLYSAGSTEGNRAETAAVLAKSEAAVERAIALDPELSQAYLALALSQSGRGRYIAAEDQYLKALALDPYDPDALSSYTYMLLAVGHLKQARPTREKLQLIEPLVPNFMAGTAPALWLTGDTDAALALLGGFSNLPSAQRLVAQIYASQGRYADAADALHLTATGTSFLAKQDQAAARLLRLAGTGAAARDLPALGAMSFAYHYVGADDRMLEFHEQNAERGFSLGGSTLLLWEPAYASVRKTERFKKLAKKQGLVDYWKARGWPDLCHPVGADDFACE